MVTLPLYHAIGDVLRRAGTPLSATEIADGLLAQATNGDGPLASAALVTAVLRDAIWRDHGVSEIVAVGADRYALREDVTPPPDGSPPEPSVTGSICAAGMHWRRRHVDWTPATPRLLGHRTPEHVIVDCGQQIGVYLLHNGDAVIHAACTGRDPLATHLRQHTMNWLCNQWDGFSWFGILPIDGDGEIHRPPVHAEHLEAMLQLVEAVIMCGIGLPNWYFRGGALEAVALRQVTPS